MQRAGWPGIDRAPWLGAEPSIGRAADQRTSGGARLNNDAVYAQGLLGKALDPSTQPAVIRSFLAQESALIRDLLPPRTRVLDFGCGTGRHLIALDGHLGPSVGFDYERASVREAHIASAAKACEFFVADATAVPLATPFDAAICLTNTWGTMSNKGQVLAEMRRLSPSAGTRLITVYSASSVDARREWYGNMGHAVLEVTDREVVAEGGFSSEHFTEERLRGLLGPCELYEIGEIAYLATC